VTVHSRITNVVSHESVNGLHFGCSETHLQEVLGEPDQAQQNYTGEVEFLYGDEIYRCLNDQLVECTIPDTGRFKVDGIALLSIFDWLAGHDDMVEKAKFRICASVGIAYDFRDPSNGSITIFTRGRWDALLDQSAPGITDSTTG